MSRSEYKKLSHVIYYHVYHIVWTPKYRYKILEGSIKSNIGKTLQMLCEWKKVEIKELNIQKDYIHIVVFVPPKISISNQEIAGKLFVSLNTVKTQAKNIYLKLDVDSRTKAVAKAKELGLI